MNKNITKTAGQPLGHLLGMGNLKKCETEEVRVRGQLSLAPFLEFKDRGIGKKELWIWKKYNGQHHEARHLMVIIHTVTCISLF